MSYGKRMLKAALQNSGSLKRAKRLPPDGDAEYFCKAGIDKDCFQLKFISDFKGYGVFSTIQLKAGDFLLQYVGQKITEEEAIIRMKKIHAENKFFFYMYKGRKWCIDAQESHFQLGPMVNDAPDSSCNSTVKLKVFGNSEYLCLFAIKDIMPGEEILYNYRDDENLWWRKKEDVKMSQFDFDSDSDPFDVGSYVSETDDNSSVEDQLNAVEDECSNLSAASTIVPVQIVKPLSGKSQEISSCQEDNDHAESLSTKEESVQQDEAEHYSVSEHKEAEPYKEAVHQDEAEHYKEAVHQDEAEHYKEAVHQDEAEHYKEAVHQDEAEHYKEAVHQYEAEHYKEAVHQDKAEHQGVAKTAAKDKPKSKKKPDRYCTYCKSVVSNGKLKRHIVRLHKCELDVKEILNQPKALQNVFFDRKRKEGIYEFNLDLLASGKDAQMRERKSKMEDQLRVCLDCQGYFSNKCFFKHKCSSKKPEPLKPKLLQKSSEDTIDKDEDFKGILNRFRDGVIGDICRTNKFVKLIGYRHFNLRRHEIGKQDEVRKVVMAEMRELAKLFQIFQGLGDIDRTVEDMLSRPYLPDLIQAIQNLTTDANNVEKHGQKLLIDAVIMRSLKTLKGYYSETMQDSKEQELKKFKNAYKHKSCELYPKARATCVTKSIEKARKPSSLPDEATLQTLKMFMKSEINFFVENYNIREYVWLRSLVVARLTLYNARRGEEAARMLQNEWADACAGVWIPDKQVEQIKDPGQQFLFGQYKLAYLKGKGRKYVPVLVPVDLITPMNILNRDRSEFGINEKNIFLFATKNSTQSHCSGWHAVAEVCKRANIDLPVNATKMRHRLSSMFASLDMNANDKKIFMDHMGHDEEINKDNYQCPPGVQAVRVMGKILIDADKGVEDSQMLDDPKNLIEEHQLDVSIADLEEGDESEDEENDEESTEEHVVSLRKSAKTKSISVKWSKTDTSIVRDAFRDFVYSENEQKNCKGSLPSKERIMVFLEENQLESLSKLSEKAKYLKIRAKVFNERKTAREITQRVMREIAVQK